MIINFDNIGGGGGGSYVLPVASQSTLGGVKVGSGLTIDSGGTMSVKYGDGLGMSGDTLVVSGGTGGGDYIIADALSAITDPTEGQMATVKSTTAATIWTKIQISDYQSFTENTGGVPESYLARIHWGDWDIATQGVEDLLAVTLYQSNETFYWNFENDGKEHTMDIERDGVYYKIAYRTYNDSDNYGNSYFLFRAIDETPYGDYIVQLCDYVGSAETAETYIVPGGTYVYSQAKWTPINSVYFLPKEGFASSAETIAFVQNIKADFARGIYPQLYHRGYIFNPTPIDINDTIITFESLHNYNVSWTAYLSDTNGFFDANGFNAAGYRFDQGTIVNIPLDCTIYIDSGGTVTGGYDDLSIVLPTENNIHRFIICYQRGEDTPDWARVPVKSVWRTVVNDVLTYYWSAEIPVNGTMYKGQWHCGEWDWYNITTDVWTAL